MKLENYKRTDLEDALDMKRMALHQLKQIEKCICTDNVAEGAVRSFNLFEIQSKLDEMRKAKEKEDLLNLSTNKQSVHIYAFHFEHKKTD